MRLDLNTIFALLSLIMCVSSNRNLKQGSKRYRQNQYRGWTWDSSLKKRDNHNQRLKLGPSSSLTSSGECCRSVMEVIQPLGGVSITGHILELYRDNNATQRFYQTSCAKGVKGKPCKFVSKLQFYSKCVQRYSYTYALVRDFESQAPPRMDYIKIRSGCSCEVRPRPKNRIILPD